MKTEDYASIEQSIRLIIAQVLERQPLDIIAEAQLVNELGADSMALLEILALIEKQFKIEIPEEQLPDMASLKIISEMVQSMLVAKNDK